MKQSSSARHLGNLLRTPAAAGLVVFGLALFSALLPLQSAQAQLPPVNMGKFVHQPGDNQYSQSTQQNRHGGGGGGYQVVQPAPQQVQGGGWTRTHKNKPDISLEPIVCDEPIARPGFPPIPDALELPGIRGGGSFSINPAGGMGGGGGMYGGSAPGMGAPPPTMHQGYQNYAPGAFSQGNKTGKGAELYKRPGAPSESYASGDGSSVASMGGPSAAQRGLNRLGKEPSLSDKGQADAAPPAPQPVQINQATTQDLSLPDDQNPNSQKKPSQFGRRMKGMQNRMMNRMFQPLYNMPVRMPGMSH